MKEKQIDIQLQDDIKHGQYLLKYENGQKMLEGFWHHGRPVGRTTTWHPNGNKSQEAHFKDGMPHGIWMSWFTNGRLKQKKEYQMGKLISEINFTEESEA